MRGKQLTICLLVACALLPRIATAQYSTAPATLETRVTAEPIPFTVAPPQSMAQCNNVLKELTKAINERSFKKWIALQSFLNRVCKPHMEGNSYVNNLGSLATALNGDNQRMKALNMANFCLRFNGNDLTCLLEKAEALYHLGRAPEAKAVVEMSLSLGAITDLDAAAKQALQRLHHSLSVRPTNLIAVAASDGATAQTREEIAAQYERDVQDCKKRYPTESPQTMVAETQCLNRAMTVVLPSWGNNRDLVQTWMSYRAVIAERIQNNKMTVTEGIAEIKQRWSELQTEVQRRNAYAAQADAARARQAYEANEASAREIEAYDAAVAQQKAADRANDIAEAQMYINAFQSLKPAPVPRLQTTCMQNGNFTYCH